MERASLVLAGLVLSATLSTAQTGPVYVPGNRASAPTLVREVKPTYTPEAKAQQIVGWVLKDRVNGRDPSLGLDQQAVKAAKQWTFKPGIRDQRPVAMRIVIEMEFKPPPR